MELVSQVVLNILKQKALIICSAYYRSRLRALFWIASSNFVLPVILSLIQLGLVFSRLNTVAASYLPLLYILNGDLEVIGVIVATIWAASHHDRGGYHSDQPPAVDGSRSRYPAVLNVAVHTLVHTDMEPSDQKSIKLDELQKVSLP